MLLSSLHPIYTLFFFIENVSVGNRVKWNRKLYNYVTKGENYVIVDVKKNFEK